MTINSFIKNYEEAATDIVANKNIESDKTLIDKIQMLVQGGFNDGLTTMIQAKAPAKTGNIASRELTESLSDAYVEKNYSFLKQYFVDMIKDVSKAGKLNVGYEDSIDESLKAAVKVIYDLGFMNGAEVAQDPKKLEIYIHNKTRIQDGN